MFISYDLVKLVLHQTHVCYFHMHVIFGNRDRTATVHFPIWVSTLAHMKSATYQKNTESAFQHSRRVTATERRWESCGEIAHLEAPVTDVDLQKITVFTLIIWHTYSQYFIKLWVTSQITRSQLLIMFILISPWTHSLRRPGYAAHSQFIRTGMPLDSIHTGLSDLVLQWYVLGP